MTTNRLTQTFALVAIVLSGALGIFSTIRVYANDSLIAHSYEVKSALASVLTGMVEAESSARGFRITGDQMSEDSYNKAASGIPERLTTVAAMTSANPRQQLQLPALRAEIERRLQQLQNVIDQRRAGGAAVASATPNGAGRASMEHIGAMVLDMTREEDQLLVSRSRDSAARVRVAMLTQIGTALAAFGLALMAARSSRQRVAELESKEQLSRRLAAIVESSDDAIIGESLAGTIESWNRGAEQTFGYTAAEAVGASIDLIIPDDRREENNHMIGLVRNNRLVEPFETLRLRKDGTLIPVSLTVSPIRNAEGAVIGASKISRDVTERKRAQDALVDLQQRLLALVGASGVAPGVAAS